MLFAAGHWNGQLLQTACSRRLVFGLLPDTCTKNSSSQPTRDGGLSRKNPIKNTWLNLTLKNCNLEKVWAEEIHGLFSTSSGFSRYVQVPHIFEETWQPVGMLKRWNRSNPWGLEAETTTTGHPPNDFCASFLWADIRWIEIPPMFFFSEYLNSLYFFYKEIWGFYGYHFPRPKMCFLSIVCKLVLDSHGTKSFWFHPGYFWRVTGDFSSCHITGLFRMS